LLALNRQRAAAMNSKRQLDGGFGDAKYWAATPSS
jgi:hypothetical protein